MTGPENGASPARGRRRRREPPPLPRHPYRDSALLHGALAVVIVVVTVLTGGKPLTGVLVALAYFALATAWSWMRFSQRIRDAARTDGGTDAGGGT
jgi:hypothetical protein